MLRSIGAVLGGYLSMVIPIMLFFVILGFSGVFGPHKDNPEMPSVYWLLAILVVSFGFAVLGGWVCASIARTAPGKHVLSLNIMMLLFWVISAFSEEGQSEPLFMRMSYLLIGIVGTTMGYHWNMRKRRTEVDAF